MDVSSHLSPSGPAAASGSRQGAVPFDVSVSPSSSTSQPAGGYASIFQSELQRGQDTGSETATDSGAGFSRRGQKPQPKKQQDDLNATGVVALTNASAVATTPLQQKLTLSPFGSPAPDSSDANSTPGSTDEDASQRSSSTGDPALQLAAEADLRSGGAASANSSTADAASDLAKLAESVARQGGDITVTRTPVRAPQKYLATNTFASGSTNDSAAKQNRDASLASAQTNTNDLLALNGILAQAAIAQPTFASSWATRVARPIKPSAVETRDAAAKTTAQNDAELSRSGEPLTKLVQPSSEQSNAEEGQSQNDRSPQASLASSSPTSTSELAFGARLSTQSQGPLARPGLPAMADRKSAAETDANPDSSSGPTAAASATSSATAKRSSTGPELTKVGNGNAAQAIRSANPTASAIVDGSAAPSSSTQEASKTAAPAQPASAEIPSTPTTPGGAHDVQVRLPDNRGGAMNIRFLETGGEVRVSVRASDSDVAQTLRSNLSDLTSRLATAGIRAETWTPHIGAAASQNGSSFTSQHQNNQSQNNQSWSNSQGRGDQSSGRQGGSQEEQPGQDQSAQQWRKLMEASFNSAQAVR